MLTLEEIVIFLQVYNLAEVSRKTGVKYHTICKIVNGQKYYDPRYRDVKALSNFLIAMGHTPS